MLFHISFQSSATEPQKHCLTEYHQSHTQNWWIWCISKHFFLEEFMLHGKKCSEGSKKWTTKYTGEDSESIFRFIWKNTMTKMAAYPVGKKHLTCSHWKTCRVHSLRWSSNQFSLRSQQLMTTGWWSSCQRPHLPHHTQIWFKSTARVFPTSSLCSHPLEYFSWENQHCYPMYH